MDPLSQETRFSYDLNGNLESATEPGGTTISFAYDALNRLDFKTLPGGEVVDFDYDVRGNLMLAEDADSKLTFTYDAVGRLATATSNPDDDPAIVQPKTTVRYTYDGAGNRKTMVDPLDRASTYTVDELSRLTVLEIPGIGDIDLQYDARGRRASLQLPNGTGTDFTYTDASQLDTLTTTSDTQTLVAQDFSYDAAGNRDDVTDLQGLHDYSYDALDRLTSALHPAPDPAESYSYDAAGTV